MVQKSGQQQQTARDDPEVGQLKHRTLHPLHVQCSDTSDYQPNVTDAGKRQHQPQIGLSQRHQRPVQHPEQTQSGHQPDILARRRRGQRHGKTQNAERAEFEAD